MLGTPATSRWFQLWSAEFSGEIVTFDAVEASAVVAPLNHSDFEIVADKLAVRSG